VICVTAMLLFSFTTLGLFSQTSWSSYSLPAVTAKTNQETKEGIARTRRERIKKFSFFVQVVAVDEESRGHWHYVEGVTESGRRFALHCPRHPSSMGIEIRGDYLKAVDRYSDHEMYKEMLLKQTNGIASIDSSGEKFTIYGDWRRAEEISEEEFADPKKLFDSVLSVCHVVNVIDHAAVVEEYLVSSTIAIEAPRGYRIIGRIGQNNLGELQLRCLHSWVTPCSPVRPGEYKVVRRGSQVRVLDSHLNAIGTYRVEKWRGRS
jgi:hypothetical protein